MARHVYSHIPQKPDALVGGPINLEGEHVSKLFTTRRRIAIVGITGAIVLGGGGAAFAYFTASGSGTGQATVGSTGTWLVSQASTTGTIYPGSGSSVITYDVKNNGAGDQQYSSATASVNSSGGDITVGGTAVSGCLAIWFAASVTSDPSVNTNVAGGSTVQDQVTVTMPSDSADNQNPCQGKSPDVTLTIS
jgi:hypothetical protein